MASDNTGVLVALIGIVAAFALVIVGRGSGSPGSSSGSTTRGEVVDGFRPQQAFLDELRSAASGSPPSGGESDLDSSTAPGSPGFAQAIVERTGYLPDGFDAAGAISRLNRLDDGQAVGL